MFNFCFNFLKVCKELSDEGKKAAERLKSGNHNQETTSLKVKLIEERQRIILEYKDDRVFTTPFHLEKLKLLFSIHNEESLQKEFPDFLYLLLRRYTTFFGVNENEGKAFHAAAPASVFETLNKEFGVCQVHRNKTQK